MRRFMLIVGALASLGAIGVAAWRRNRRLGTDLVNRVVNPWLLGRRLAGSGRSELGTLEHVGRKSGIRRLTPVHPERTEGGFQIIAPLGTASEWARNVIAAGHCRLQLHDVLYELDEPRLVLPSEAVGLPRVVQGIETRLGFRYVSMRIFAEAPGALAAPEQSTSEPTEPEPEPAAATEPAATRAPRRAPRRRARSAPAPLAMVE